MEPLIKQLDTVKHLASCGYWVTTEELCLLLELDSVVLAQLQTKDIPFQFVWRNFTCHLISQHETTNLWSFTTKPIHLNRFGQVVNPYLALKSEVLPNPYTTKKLEAKLETAIPALDSEVLPSYHWQLENFLSPDDLSQLFKYTLDQEPNFISTSNSSHDLDYRRSLFLANFPPFSDLLIRKVRAIVPDAIKRLQILEFKIDHIEAQLTAHNDGNYYKIHNDNGSENSATRELTYVYYFYREPKPFTGGELLIYDSKVENNFYVAANSYHTIQPLNNSIVIFLSRYMHEVLPVKVASKAFTDSRFTINGWVRRQ